MTKRELPPRTTLATDRRGAILLFMALTMVAFMGVMLFAVDGGLLQRQKRRAQAAADAAAQAGAQEILRNKTTLVITSAQAEATRNGFTHGVASHSVTISYPNTLVGTHTGTDFVGVLVKDTVSTVFGSVFGRRKVVINARAVGGVSGTTQNCLTVLDPGASQALKITSQAVVNAVGCNIAVNSNSSSAMYIANSSLVADGISITGTGPGWSGKSYTIDANGAASGAPPPTTNVPAAGDPLAGVVYIQNSADTLGCPGVTNANPANTLLPNAYRKVIPANGDVLNPGIYCGGIRVGSDNTVWLKPGLYVIKGFGLYVGGGGRLKGFGTTNCSTPASPVNIVNLAGVGASALSDFEGFDFASDAIVCLAAATDRVGLSGILFFSPPGQGNHLPEENSVESSGVGLLNGSMYFPDQLLHVGSSEATLTINGGIVAKIVEFLADANVTITGFGGANPNYTLRRGSVVE